MKIKITIHELTIEWEESSVVALAAVLPALVGERVQTAVAVTTPTTAQPAPQKSEPIDKDNLKALVIAELKRLAKDGVAPTLADWEVAKDSRIPRYKTLYVKLGMGYKELAALAGVIMDKPPGRRKEVPVVADPVAKVAMAYDPPHLNGTR